jgi:hypothetical protein
LLDECLPTRLSRDLAGHEALIAEVLAVCRDIRPGQVVTVG